MKYLFKSERLGFRVWEDSDIDPFVALNADEQVMEYFENTSSKESTLALIQRIKGHYKEFGYCLYAVDCLEESRFIGFIGFMPDSMEQDISPCIEIGWRLDKTTWNKGLATEGAKRCIEYAFDNLGIKEIYSCTAVLNKKSERVMQKIGMKYLNNFNHPRVSEDHQLREHVLYHMVNPK